MLSRNIDNNNRDCVNDGDIIGLAPAIVQPKKLFTCCAPPSENGISLETTDPLQIVVTTSSNADNDNHESDGIIRPTSDYTSNSIKDNIRTNRIRMTILHYVLTYSQFSFVLFMYLSCKTLQMSFNNKIHIWDPIHNLNTVIQNESTLYKQCVDTGFQYHTQQMNTALQEELRRMERVRNQHLNPYMKTIIDETDRCHRSTGAIKRSLQTWHSSLGMNLPERGMVLNHTSPDGETTVNNNVSNACTYQDHEQFMQLLLEQNDIYSIQGAMNDQLNLYITSSLQSIDTLVQYSYDRSTYDYNYFIGIKVQTTIQLLDQFIVLPTIFNITFQQQSFIVNELRTILQDILDALHGAHLQIDVLSQRLLDFQASIQLFYINYSNLYDRFTDINSFVIDFLPTTVKLPDYFDISNIPLPNTLLPIDYNNIPNFHLHLPNITRLADAFVNDAIQFIITFLQETVNDVTEQARSTVQLLIESLRNVMQLDDYNPPTYPIMNKNVSIPQDEKTFIGNIAQNVQLDVSKSFDKLYQTEQADETTETIPTNIRNMTWDDATNNHTKVSTYDISYPEFHYPIWISSIIKFIISNSFYLECLIQAYRLYKLKCKYEANSTPDLPTIDYLLGANTNGNNNKNELSFQTKLNAARFVLLKHVMNPWIIVGLVLVPCMIVLFAFWFPHIKDSCIDSNKGTYLARHILKPINVNRANSQGYALHNLQQVQCYNRQRYICNTQMMISDSALRSDMATIHALQVRFNESNVLRGIVGRCVETKVLDDLFYLHCCGLEMYNSSDNCQPEQMWMMCPIDNEADPPASFRPVGEELREPICNMYPTIDEYTDVLYFNCSTIERTCSSVPCAGVDENLIEKMTTEADCIVEIYGIQLCFFIALAVYHAIMINIINKLIFNGLLQIQWKRLKPDGISFITSINSDGQFVQGSNQQERAELVQHVMKQYVRAGYVQVAVGGAIIVFWIASLFTIRQAASHLIMYTG